MADEKKPATDKPSKPAKTEGFGAGKPSKPAPTGGFGR